MNKVNDLRLLINSNELTVMKFISFIAVALSLERPFYSVVESDGKVSICVTAGGGDGSEVFTLSLVLTDITTHGMS